MGTRAAVATLSIALFFVACASNPLSPPNDEMAQRKEAELSKAADNAELVCVPESNAVNYLLLFYNPWDRGDYRPILLPQLEADVIAKITSEIPRFKAGTETQMVLAGRVNDIVNERLADFNSGRFNAIYVSIGAGIHLGIAPAGPDRLHVWVPKGRTKAQTARKTKEDIYIFDRNGTLIEKVSGKKARKLANITPYMASWSSGIDKPGYWTFAAWPSTIRQQQVELCKSDTGKIVRH